MTNREWLESLSDEEFADFMMSADTCMYCGMGGKDWNCIGKEIPCAIAKIWWLRAEHSDDDN